MKKGMPLSRKELVVFVFAVALLSAAFSYAGSSRTPIASSETRFVEYSKSGLRIVPASCPSSPDYNGGSCSGPGTQDPYTATCGFWASAYTIQQGQQTTLNWSSPGLLLASISGVGTFSSAGSAAVSPSQTTTYTATVYNSGVAFAATCDLTITVAQSGPPSAPAGLAAVCLNPTTVQLSWNPTSGATAYHLRVDNLQTNPSPDIIDDGASSPSTRTVVADASYDWWVHAVNGSGGSGATHGSFQCNSSQVDACSNISGIQANPPGNSYISGTQCLCNSGYTLQNGQCVAVATCSAQYYCVGNNLYYRNAQCAESLNQACTWGCSGGGCLPAPPGSGTITASPALIKSAETSVITWSAQNVQAGSCRVTENNPDITDSWTGSSGTRTTSEIRMQTSYTLSCTGQNGTPFTDSVKVNVIPVFEEQ